MTLFDAVTGIVRESGASPAQATAALVDIAFWLAGTTAAESPAHCQALEHAFNSAWPPAFRAV
jgi:hypothetical protein